MKISGETHEFRSSLFEVEPLEDSETNPRRYGRQLSRWLEGQLRPAYPATEVIPEDWGWCVLCQSKPFMLWIGCGNAIDYVGERPDDPPPAKDQIIWHAFVFAERPFWKTWFGKIDMAPAVDKLDGELKSILQRAQGIQFIK